jgi:hypothetical protein
MKLPSQTSDIFHRLSKGKFICANSTNLEVRQMYAAIAEEDNFDLLRDYFAQIDFILEQGDRFYFFSRKETKQNLDNKINAALKWILILDFLVAYDAAFSHDYCGYSFNMEDIALKCYADPLLRSKKNGLTRYLGEKSEDKIVEAVIKTLIDDNFVEIQTESVKKYKVLNSFHYLHQLVLNIHISKETQDELSN